MLTFKAKCPKGHGSWVQQVAMNWYEEAKFAPQIYCVSCGSGCVVFAGKDMTL